MKQILLIFLFIGIGLTARAQPIYASTTPSNKMVILEELTGVRCGACPSGHQYVHNLLEDYPNQVIALAYSPENSTLTAPHSGDENLTRTYLNAFYNKTYLGKRFMPGGVTNRRVWANGNRLQSRSLWKTQAETIMAEASPVNVGLHSSFDDATNKLTIDVEVYFTATTGELKLFVHLIEDDIQVNKQSGSSISPYTLNHVFREHLNTEQWGDEITGTTTQGSLYSTQFVFDLDDAIAPIDVEKLHIVAFVNDVTSGETLTGKSTEANSPTVSTQTATLPDVNISPNPVSSEMYVSFTANTNQSNIQIFNILGQQVYSHQISGKGSHQLAFEKNSLNVKQGLYLIQITSGDQSYTSKIVFE